MGNEFLWEKAKKIDSSLEGANWPENLTLPQIARQRFPNDESDEKALLRLLSKKAEDGSLEFCAIKVNYKWHWPNVSYSIAGDYGQPAWLRDDIKKRRDDALLKEHEPVCGWLEALKGVELNNPIKLEQHLCGCNSECTMGKTYHNGLPKRWRVEGVHEDGLKINFSCESEPLLSARQCRDFLDVIGQPIPTDSILNGWGGDLKMQFQAGVNNDTKNQAATEQSSTNNQESLKNSKEPKRRCDNLKKAILAVCELYGKKPPFEELWNFFLDDKDETGIIADFTDTHLSWRDTKGNIIDTQKESVANRLSRINYP